MKKIFFTFAMIMATIITMAQSQFYVIMKDGSGASFPEATVDSLTFNDDNGATIFGLKDIVKRMDAMQRSIDSLKKIVLQLTPADTTAYMHEYVDLGLPSGTLWATCNVGAKRSYQYGFYICWGETDQKSNYSLTGGKWSSYDLSELAANGVIDSHNNLTAEYDAATVLWGDDWRMPTTDEFDELIKYTTQTWVDENGTNGVLFTSKKNKSSIFLPCSGMIRDNVETMVGTRAYYLGATATDGSASSFYMSQGDEPGTLDIRTGATSRSHGRTIRAVRKTKPEVKPDINPGDDDKSDIEGGNSSDKDDNTNKDDNTGEKEPTIKYVDLGLPSGTLWANSNLNITEEYPLGTKYAWGETETKLEFTEDNSLWLNATDEELLAKGVINKDNHLTAQYDIATLTLGNYWTLPTKEQVDELFTNCSLKFIDSNTIMITGKNGNHITFSTVHSYWTKTNVDQHIAYSFYFIKDVIEDTESVVPISVQCMTPHGKYIGCFIRPVIK